MQHSLANANSIQAGLSSPLCALLLAAEGCFIPENKGLQRVHSAQPPLHAQHQALATLGSRRPFRDHGGRGCRELDAALSNPPSLFLTHVSQTPAQSHQCQTGLSYWWEKSSTCLSQQTAPGNVRGKQRALEGSQEMLGAEREGRIFLPPPLLSQPTPRGHCRPISLQDRHCTLLGGCVCSFHPDPERRNNPPNTHFPPFPPSLQQLSQAPELPTVTTSIHQLLPEG